MFGDGGAKGGSGSGARQQRRRKGWSGGEARAVDGVRGLKGRSRERAGERGRRSSARRLTKGGKTEEQEGGAAEGHGDGWLGQRRERDAGEVGDADGVRRRRRRRSTVKDGVEGGGGDSEGKERSAERRMAVAKGYGEGEEGGKEKGDEEERWQDGFTRWKRRDRRQWRRRSAVVTERGYSGEGGEERGRESRGGLGG